jgi:hypothetical protein
MWVMKAGTLFLSDIDLPCNFSFRMQSLRKKTIMKASKLFFVSIIAATLITSCDWHTTRTVVGSGDVEYMEVQVPEFTGVTVTGTCNVEIRTGEVQSVELSAQSQILDVMTYEVNSGILEISFRPEYTVKTSKKISAYIVVPSFDFAGITGAGDFEISGAAQPALSIYITGTGNVDAFDMEVDDCDIRIEGSGNCEINVNDNLDVQVSGVGNIFYMGHPVITQNISGVGNVTAVSN